MSLSKKIADALDENTRAYVMPWTVAVEDTRGRLTLRLTALDSVGLAFTALEYAVLPRAEWSPETLAAWGQRITNKVVYLMEPLKVLEVDAGGGLVQLRSQSPTPKADQRNYYEIRLHRDGMLTMERFAFDDATRTRAIVPCQLTREVLDRLIGDLRAAAV